jgi:hypothetical protein
MSAFIQGMHLEKLISKRRVRRKNTIFTLDGQSRECSDVIIKIFYLKSDIPETKIYIHSMHIINTVEAELNDITQ